MNNKKNLVYSLHVMSDSTLSKISELIKLEDDLAKIGSIRQQFLKEKSSVDVKLSSTTQVQIDSIMKNLANLHNTMERLDSIKGSIGEVQQVHDSTIGEVREYDTIKKMTMVNQFYTKWGVCMRIFLGSRDLLGR